MARDPRIHSAWSGRKPTRDARRGTTSPDERGQVVVVIAYDGLAHRPTDRVLMSPREARRIAVEMLTAADQADDDAPTTGDPR